MKYIYLISVNFIIFYSLASAEGWVQQNSGITHNLNSIFFLDESMGFAVGDNGILLTTENAGQKWEAKKLDTDWNLNCVYFADLMNGWVVGDSATIFHTTDGGQSWMQQECKYETNITKVHFLNEEFGYVAGSSRLLFTTDGGYTWVRDPLGSSNSQYIDVHVISEERIWVIYRDLRNKENNIAVKNFGGWGGIEDDIFKDLFISENEVLKVFLYSSQIYFVLNTPNEANLYYAPKGLHFQSVTCIDSTNIWVVGDKGMIMHSRTYYDDLHHQNSQVSTDLNDICFINKNLGWVVGDDGVILHTDNGGNQLEDPFFREDFENDISMWNVKHYEEDFVPWEHIKNEPDLCFSGSGCFRAQHDASHVGLMLDKINIPKDKKTVLSYWIRSDKSPEVTSTANTKYQVNIARDTAKYHDFFHLMQNFELDWHKMYIDLSKYAGDVINIEWAFRPNEPMNTYIDDIEIVSFVGNEVSASLLTYEYDEFKVYPNPANTFVNIETKNNSATEYTLLNFLGEQEMSGMIVGNSSRVEIEALPSGIYILRINNKGYKVIKN